MTKAIKLCTNGDVELLDVPDIKDFHWYADQIGCDYIEAVYPQGLSEPNMMVVDEEGLLKEKPLVNFIASWLYGTQEHGHPICGDVLVMQNKLTPEGLDIVGIPEEEARALLKELANMLVSAYQTIRSKLF